MTNPTNQGGELNELSQAGKLRGIYKDETGNDATFVSTPENCSFPEEFLYGDYATWLEGYACKLSAAKEREKGLIGRLVRASNWTKDVPESGASLKQCVELFDILKGDNLPEDQSETETVNALRDENAALEAKLEMAKNSMADAYTSGYMGGHNDTVEGQYGDPVELGIEWLADNVGEYQCFSDTRPALAVVEGYSLDGCFPDDVFMDGRMQIYEEQTDEQEMLYTVVVLERKEP